MEYIVIGLCIIILTLMVLLYRAAKENDITVSTYVKDKSNLEGQITYSKALANAATERSKQIAKELSDAYKRLEISRIEKLKYTGGSKIINSEYLKNNLRFILPDEEIANTVKVKLTRDGEKIIGIHSTVRKKVNGKFTDVEVVPTIL